MEEESWERNHGRGITEEESFIHRGIMGEEPWRRNPGRGIMGEESWRRNHGKGIMGKESWGAIWRHLEPSGTMWHHLELSLKESKVFCYASHRGYIFIYL